jgi:hypothetical protein
MALDTIHKTICCIEPGYADVREHAFHDVR